MKLFGMSFDKSAKDKQWGFTSAASPRFIAGSDTGVLLCHGFGGSPANMRCLAEAAEGMGLTVAVPLLKGHAQTLGDMEKCSFEDWRADAEEAYRSLLSRGCRRVILCGLSMGALLMADLAERHAGESELDSLIMISPALKMRGYLNFSNHVLKRVTPYVLTAESFNGNPDMEMYYGMATSKLRDIERLSKLVRANVAGVKVPVRLIAAGHDIRVAPKTYRILNKKLGDCSYSVIEGASHGIPYSSEADKLVELFREFINGRLNAPSAEKRPI